MPATSPGSSSLISICQPRASPQRCARLGAAGAGVDGEDAVAAVVRPVEHQFQLE